MRPLDIDRLSQEELRALGAIEQLHLLNDLLGELHRLADVKCEAIDARADAKMQAIHDPSPLNKARVVDAQRVFDKVGVAIAARKAQASILQSILRAVPV